MSIMSRGAERLTGLRLSVAFARSRSAVVAGLHAAALIVLWWTEFEPEHIALFVLAWGVFNCAWLVVLGRPSPSAAASLLMVGAVIVLSKFKAGVTWASLSFFDFLIVDPDTVHFLTAAFPRLRIVLPLATIVAVILLVGLWRLDPFRVRRLTSALIGAGCLVGLCSLSLAVPEQPWEPFQANNYVSNFVRSGVTTVVELATHGWLEADAPGADASVGMAAETCRPVGKPPHIIMVLDESSFDVRAAPGIKLPADYGGHFRSFDGRQRALTVEATGGPTWYAEYSVLTGLSPRSFGRLSLYVTRIAAGHVLRGLPQALQNCGYRTFSLYPESGAFMGARGFQATTGIEHFIDASDMHAGHVEPDSFYFDRIRETIARENAGGPLFIMGYVTANHFPWTPRFRPGLTPDWKDLGNDPEVDEYIRRQMMSAHDYADFLARLKREFPNERF